MTFFNCSYKKIPLTAVRRRKCGGESEGREQTGRQLSERSDAAQTGRKVTKEDAGVEETRQRGRQAGKEAAAAMTARGLSARKRTWGSSCVSVSRAPSWRRQGKLR